MRCGPGNRPGDLSVVTGIPGSGKSELLDAMMVNLAQRYGWRFGICSFENPPGEHIAKLAEKYVGQPFWEGPAPRIANWDQLQIGVRRLAGIVDGFNVRSINTEQLPVHV